jgi:hypothetical protein
VRPGKLTLDVVREPDLDARIASAREAILSLAADFAAAAHPVALQAAQALTNPVSWRLPCAGPQVVHEMISMGIV